MTSFAGFDLLAGALKSYAGASFITLKDWEERTGPGQDSESFVRQVMGFGDTIPEANVIAFNPPPITVMSTTGGIEVYLKRRTAASPQEIEETSQALVSPASERPERADWHNELRKS